MPLGPFGALFLDGVRFSTDPAVYEPMNWAKRHSVHPAIGGKVTIQDFGTFMKDNTLRLQSGDRQFLDLETVNLLHARYRTKGALYLLTDWLSNQFQVFILNFVPVPNKSGIDGNGNNVSLFTYQMELHVLSIGLLLGQPYTGS